MIHIFVCGFQKELKINPKDDAKHSRSFYVKKYTGQEHAEHEIVYK